MGTAPGGIACGRPVALWAAGFSAITRNLFSSIACPCWPDDCVPAGIEKPGGGRYAEERQGHPEAGARDGRRGAKQGIGEAPEGESLDVPSVVEDDRASFLGVEEPVVPESLRGEDSAEEREEP